MCIGEPWGVQELRDATHRKSCRAGLGLREKRFNAAIAARRLPFRVSDECLSVMSACPKVEIFFRFSGPVRCHPSCFGARNASESWCMNQKHILSGPFSGTMMKHAQHGVCDECPSYVCSRYMPRPAQANKRFHV